MGYVNAKAPKAVYHLTQRKNLPSILNEKTIKRFSDQECWFCESIPNLKKYMEYTIIFLTVILIPIVPGSDLYYSMRYLLLRDFLNFSQSFKYACSISAGITFGITVVSVMVKLLMAVKKAWNYSKFAKGDFR